MTKEEFDKIRDDCDLSYYSPSESMEYYNSKTKQWYTQSGLHLRDPEEFNPRSEGYTPFGDE